MSTTSDSRGSRTFSDQRRRFIQALAATGAVGVAGCLGGQGGDGGSPTPGDGNGGPGRSPGGPGPAPGGNDDTGDAYVPPASEPFLLPAGSVDSTFDVELNEATDLLEGEALAALTDFDLEGRRFTLNADRLAEAGLSPDVGRIFWVSGLSMGRVTDVTSEGDAVVVETEMAPLNEAIQDGVVEWDAQLGFEERRINDAFEETGLEPDAVFDPALASAALVDVEVLDADGEFLGRPSLATGDDPEEVFEMRFTQGNTDYLFGLTPMGDEVRIRVQMSAPSGEATNMRFTGVGEFKTVRAGGRADYAGGELQSATVSTSGIEGEVVVDIAAAGSGVDGPTEIPLPGGFAFKYITMIGPIPLTVKTSMRLIARINVVAGASATARSRFSFRGDTGFIFDGREVIPEATIATLDISPERADSAGAFGQPVGVGFGVAAPRISISLFEEFVIPFVEVGMAVNSNLSWGPVCKDAYLQLVVKGGYDLTILGTDLGGVEHKFAEVERRAGGETGEGCGR